MSAPHPGFASNTRGPLRPVLDPYHDTIGRIARDTTYGVSRESTISLNTVRALVEVVARAGVPSAQFLQAAQLQSDQLCTQGRISRWRVYQLCELALDLTGDCALGLHWAEKLSESTFIPVSQLIAHAPTLRQGLETMAQLDQLLSDETDYKVLESEDKVTLRTLPLIGASDRAARFLSEVAVTGFLRLLRDFCADARPARVSFDYPAPIYHGEYTRVFGCPVLFAQPFSGIVFAGALLDVPSPHKDEALHEALRSVAQRRLLEISERTSYTQRVRDILVRSCGPHRTDLDEVANSLGVSVRTLRRRLSREGTSYQSVANESVMIVAKHLLLSRQHTIQETAYVMGFADASSFHRAFRRWTGTTPAAYRKAQRACMVVD